MLHDLICMMFLINETQRRKELNGGKGKQKVGNQCMKKFFSYTEVLKKFSLIYNIGSLGNHSTLNIRSILLTDLSVLLL